MAEQAQEVEATLAMTHWRALNEKAPTPSLVAQVSWHNKLLYIQGGWSPINTGPVEQLHGGTERE